MQSSVSSVSHVAVLLFPAPKCTVQLEKTKFRVSRAVNISQFLYQVRKRNSEQIGVQTILFFVCTRDNNETMVPLTSSIQDIWDKYSKVTDEHPEGVLEFIYCTENAFG